MSLTGGYSGIKIHRITTNIILLVLFALIKMPCACTVCVCTCVQVFNRHKDIHVQYKKKKKKTARVASRMHLNPNRTQPVLAPTCQIHQATQKFHRYEERQEVTAVFWSGWSLTVSEDHCVCLPVSQSAPDLRRKTTRLKKKGLHFHLTQGTGLAIPKWDGCFAVAVPTICNE